jgi:hypothetical protein
MTFLSSPITFSGKFNDPALPHTWVNILKQHYGFSTFDWTTIEDILTTMSTLKDFRSLKSFFQMNNHFGLLVVMDLSKVTLLHNIKMTKPDTLTNFFVGNKLMDLPLEFQLIPKIFTMSGILQTPFLHT